MIRLWGLGRKTKREWGSLFLFLEMEILEVPWDFTSLNPGFFLSLVHLFDEVSKTGILESLAVGFSKENLGLLLLERECPSPNTPQTPLPPPPAQRGQPAPARTCRQATPGRARAGP